MLSRSMRQQANNACTRLGVRAAFFSVFLALADSRFEGESPLPPEAGNANRWAAVLNTSRILAIYPSGVSCL